jgi:hypothetical protein
MNQTTVGEVMTDLGNDEARQRAGEILAGQTTGTPWYVRLMLAFGAWLATLFFIGFFSLLTHSKPVALFSGMVMVFGAILVRRSDPGEFLKQLAFAASLSGQVLILIGSNPHDAVTVATLLLLMQGMLIVFYADQTHRVLSTLIATSAIEVLFFEWKWAYGTPVLAGVMGIVSIHLWWKESAYVAVRLERLARPVAYGLVLSMLGLLLPSMFPAFITNDTMLRLFGAQSWITAALLGVGLLYLVHLLLDEYGLPALAPPPLAIYGAALLLVVPGQRAPGLLGALIVLLLGFRHGNRVLMGIALLFLAVFLSAYYYNLSISLLMKSAALAGSGAILLGLRWLLLRQWQAGEEHHA